MGFSERRLYPWGFVFRIIGVLLSYFLTRSLFYYFNRDALSAFSASDIMSAFALGFRFDAWLVAATFAPFFFLELWSWKSRSERAFRLTSLYSGFVFLLHSVFIFFELADTQYFKFTGRRTTLAILKLSSDAADQSLQLLKNFWIVPTLGLGFVILLATLWLLTRKLTKNTRSTSVTGKQLAVNAVVGICIFVLGLRGGFQTKPIATAHAMLLGNPQLAALAMSTSFQMTHSAENRELSTVNFFENEQETRKRLEVPRTRFAPVTLKNYNVVIIVFESLSLEYFGYQGINNNYVPFIKKLAEKSLFFDNAYANGRTSIEAFPSILASLPSMVGEPFITSQYSSVQTLSLGHELAKRGYNNQFFHGCNNGSMHIDSMAKLFGFPKFFGRSEYPHNQRDFDGNWGIYDEPFLQFAIEKINATDSPFATGIFTLSSHNPYNIPAHLRDKFPDGKQLFHKSLGYADYALEKFFESASQQPWFQNTLFVITGDHTADLESPKFMTEQGYYRVPLIFYDPSGKLKPSVNHRIVQHTDIFPTVLDLLGVDASEFTKPLLPFGQSAFLPDKYARAANRAGDWFWYQEGRSVVRIPANKRLFSEPQIDVHAAHAGDSSVESALEIVEIGEDTLTTSKGRSPTPNEHDGIVKRGMAYLQFFNNRLAHNSLLEP